VNIQRAVAFFTILIVILIVAAAFMVLGPPSRERAEALDRQRIDDIRHIEGDLHDTYGTAKQPIPGRLSNPKRDPVTAAPYEYRRIGATRYVICATFDRPSPNTGDRTLDDSPFWRHAAGRTCYQFEVRRESLE
jgi:hypothetical protein